MKSVKIMDKKDYIQIALPYTDDSDWYSIKESINSGWLTQGPKVKAFEEQFLNYIGAKYSLALTSCTTALHLALLALGITKNDVVVIPSFTWIATANAVEYCGATPIFCDVDKNTYNMDVEKLEELIKNLANKGIYPKAVIPVHLFGLCCDMDKINKLADKYNLKVVEDAACAVGAKYKNKFAGALSDIGCFSFHPRKIITTGEGGMCTTNSDELYEKINRLRNHGASISEEMRHFGNKPYLMPDFDELGYNYRMTDIQGAVGLTQLAKLNKLLNERKIFAKRYDQQLKDIEWLKIPEISENCEHSYQSYVCFVDEEKAGKKRNEIMEILHEKGIATRPGTHAVHELGYYSQKYNLEKNECPIASELYAKTMAIPLHNKMNCEDQEYIIKTLKDI
jgi:dTDP-4-amino-4,6-dideoxygalactose transaminase